MSLPLGSATVVSSATLRPASETSAPSAAISSAFVSAGAVAPAGAATFTAPPARILLTEPAAPVSSGVWIVRSPPL
ncbi:hypothetical protein D3C87_1179600 [compost metagenome]